MRLTTTLSMCASAHQSTFGNEIFLTQIAHERVAKCAAGFGAVSRERNRCSPQPGAQGHMTGKRAGAKSPVGRYKAIERGQAKVDIVGDGFQNRELDSSRLSSLSYGCGLHIHRDRTVGSAQSRFLFLAGYRCRAHQDPIASTNVGSDTIGSINHRSRVKNVPDVQRIVQRSGKAN